MHQGTRGVNEVGDGRSRYTESRQKSYNQHDLSYPPRRTYFVDSPQLPLLRGNLDVPRRYVKDESIDLI